MQLLKISFTLALTVSSSFTVIACKTRRTTVDVAEVPITPPPVATASAKAAAVRGTDESKATLLRVNDLTFPANPKAYDRIALTLSSSGEATQDIYDYTLGDTMDLVPGKTYSLIVQTFAGEVATYSNVTCKTSTEFVAKSGFNDLKMTLCAGAAPVSAVPSDPGTSVTTPEPIPLTTP
ncbi:MAG: hypothetical protein H7249_20550 [Chitinophagaceae bacterium]|nr:hypothetical protein [Oligoflexus sp.]